MNGIFKNDLNNIFSNLSDIEKEKLNGAEIMITGCAGFLGFYLTNFFSKYKKEFGISRIIGLDNFKMGCPRWLNELKAANDIILKEFDVVNDRIESIDGSSEVDYIYHMASIASPTFYRAFPLETIDANVSGLRKLLDFYRDKHIKGMVFFSSSEIYGDPPAKNVPTSEEYRGNVSCVGPRACYDEAKRFGEALCYVFYQKYGVPVTIVRPFNNYGPGMKLNDKRVPADFARAILKNEDITMYSDGKPTRTFCYISDAISGYIKASLYGKFETFNIGIDDREVSIKDLAEIYKSIGEKKFGYDGEIIFKESDEANYLADNPNRRSPNINKARDLLKFAPQVSVEEGVERFLTFLNGDDYHWME
ncbi:MAG: NAD-dependent epimerase/dehydratase family protein [Holosporaceae bacterium]|jgi:UDP-glucuronate decarboxylase|nr:NAD-dependent epimerase/dehydratase family protein [Holosporaceae bacterium]